MLIRKLKKSDSAKVAPLIKQLTPNIVDREKLLERIEKLVDSKNSQYLVAQNKGLIIGFGGLAWYLIPSKGQVGWIEELVVEEKYRGQGVGQRLLKELIKLAETKKIKQIKLTTANPVARSLYQKARFIYKKENLMVRRYY